MTARECCGVAAGACKTFYHEGVRKVDDAAGDESACMQLLTRCLSTAPSQCALTTVAKKHSGVMNPRSNRSLQTYTTSNSAQTFKVILSSTTSRRDIIPNLLGLIIDESKPEELSDNDRDRQDELGRQLEGPHHPTSSGQDTSFVMASTLTRSRTSDKNSTPMHCTSTVNSLIIVCLQNDRV